MARGNSRRSRGFFPFPFSLIFSPPLSFLSSLLILLLPFLAIGLSSCGGPMPPKDSFYVSASKSALARGNDYYLRGCHAEALKYFEEGLISSRLADDVTLMTVSLNAVAAAKMARGDYPGAALSLEAALEESLNDPARPVLPTILGNLGAVAHKSGRESDARELWERAASLSEERGESPAAFLASLARDDYQKERRDAFPLSLQRALESLDHPDTDDLSRADILNLAGLSALRQGDLSRAESLLNSALTLDRKNENQKGLSEDLEAFAALEKEKGSFEKSAVYLGRAFYLRTALKDKGSMERVFKLLEEAVQKGAPTDLSPYRRILRSPDLFDPLTLFCPAL
jgi:tetratricopeptide (TPR) repeat protein